MDSTKRGHFWQLRAKGFFFTIWIPGNLYLASLHKDDHEPVGYCEMVIGFLFLTERR